MKKNLSLKKILSASLLLAVSIASAQATTNKTFLMSRDVGTNMARNHATWHKMRNSQYKGKNHFGARFEVAGFYQDTVKQKEIGQYFGFADATNVEQDFIGVDPVVNSSYPLFPTDIIHNQLFANPADASYAVNNTLKEKQQFNPRREIWGANFTYYQSLNALVNGLYLKVSSPLAYIRSSLGTVSTLTNTKQTLPGTSTSVSALDYLAGNVEQTANPNKQAALKSAKIADHRCETVLADVKAEIGYDLVQKDDMHLGLSALMVAPTSDVATGEFLLEPIAGTGHWAVGGTLDGHYDWTFGEDKEMVLGLHAGVNYQWVFEKNERRTLGFNRRNGKLATFGHYILGGQKGQQGLFPLANVLTRDVEVTPGHKVDAITALNFSYENWTFDLGYNVFYKDAEELKLKESWIDDTYAVAQFAYDTSVAFDVTNNAHAYQPAGATPLAIQSSDIVLSVAQTPVQLSHKIYGGIGYVAQHCSSPISFGIGGGYEFAGNENTPEQWEAWAKIGLAI